MTPERIRQCQLSEQPYKWQHNGGWQIGKIVLYREMLMTPLGTCHPENASTLTLVQVMIGMDGEAGLWFVPWGEMTEYSRGEGGSKS